MTLTWIVSCDIVWRAQYTVVYGDIGGRAIGDAASRRFARGVALVWDRVGGNGRGTGCLRCRELDQCLPGYWQAVRSRACRQPCRLQLCGERRVARATSQGPIR